MYEQSTTPRYRGGPANTGPVHDSYDKSDKGGGDPVAQVDDFITDNFMVLMFALSYVMVFIGAILISLILHLKVGRHQAEWAMARNILIVILIPMTLFVFEPRLDKWMAPIKMVKGGVRRLLHASQHEGGVMHVMKSWWTWRKKVATQRVDIV